MRRYPEDCTRGEKLTGSSVLCLTVLTTTKKETLCVTTLEVFKSSQYRYYFTRGAHFPLSRSLWIPPVCTHAFPAPSEAGSGIPLGAAHVPAVSCSPAGTDLGNSHDSSRSNFEAGREPLKNLNPLLFVDIF